MVAVFFLLLFFILTPISVYLLIRQRDNRLILWGALTILVAGMSGLQVGLEKIIIPHGLNSGYSEEWIMSLHIVSDFLNIVVNSFPYYLILIFFLHYTGFPKAIYSVILLVPVLLSFVFCGMYPTPFMNYNYILSWGIPYMIGSLALFVWVLWKERALPKKRYHAGIALMFFTPETYLLLLQLEGIYFDWTIDFLMYIPFLCLLCILLGVVLYVHNVFLPYQNKAVLTKMQVGTSLMQHAFKNAISKNKLHALNMQRSLEMKQYDNIDHHLRSLLRTNEHLMGMVSKLSYLTRSRISTEMGPIDISNVLDAVIDQFRNSIVTFVKPHSPIILKGDPMLLEECFTNVISNAVEAMDEHGSITISIAKVKRKAMIMFTDTGRGMDKEQLRNLFDPFYSTKLKSGQNFGLGMFHINKIMDVHQGKVKVTSQVGKGTVVTLIFPLAYR